MRPPDTASEKHKLYTELADWWPLVSAREEYAEEAAWFRRTILDAAQRPVTTVLELGSDGGNMASHLKKAFSMTLVDLSEQMLEVSGKLNPECDHIAGDMRRVRLGRAFDAVLVHDAIVHLTTQDDLAKAIHTAFDHCRPGGVAVIAPDFVCETFQPGTSHGGHDGPDGRALRYLQWTWDPDSADTAYLMDFAFLLREPDGHVRVESDRHVCGLFPRQFWLAQLGAAGFHGTVVADRPGREVLVGVRKADGARA